MSSLGFKREPVAWVEATKAVIVCAIAFGLPVTTEQLGLIVAALTAIAGLVIRQNVYAPINAQGQPIIVVHPEPDFTPRHEPVPFVDGEAAEPLPEPPPSGHKTPEQLLQDYKDRVRRK